MFDFDMLPIGAFEPRPGGGMRLYGGKGGDTPAPDPRLVEAQIRSMGIQDSAIQRVMQQSDEMQPLQKEQLQFGLESARTAYDQSQSDRKWMLDRRGSLSGMQDTLVQDAKTFNTEAKREELAGQAGADVAQGFGAAREQNARALTRMGVDPSSGRALAMGNQMSMAQALGTAQAKTGARTQARQEGFALTDRATNALSGFPAMGMQATMSGAGLGASGTTIANQGLAGMNSGYGAAGTMAGQMGQNASSMYGTQASAHSQAQTGQGAMTGSVIGAGAGIAVAMI